MTDPYVAPEPAGAPPRLQEGRAASLLAVLAPSRRAVVIASTLAVSAAAYWLTRGTIGEMPARTLSIILIAAAFWATEVLPLFATAFVVVGLEILFLAADGGLAAELTAILVWSGFEVAGEAPATPIRASLFLEPLADDIIVLFLGAFLLAAAIRKHGVDDRLATRVLRPFAASPLRLLVGVLTVSAFFSMWMSNTATAAMMLAMVAPTVGRLPAQAPFRMAILLAVPFGANIGGIGTPIGSPPNAIAYGVLNQAGYEVTFLAWMLVAVPLAVLLLAATTGVLYARFRPAAPLHLTIGHETRPLDGHGRAALIILVVTVILWILSGWHGLRPGAVALLAAAALTAFGVLDRDDVDSIDWNILILMWGALSLSVAAEHSGLLAQIRRVDPAMLPGGAWSAGILVAVVAVGLSTVMSNTATAALLVPTALALSLPGREQFAMLAALACSFGMALPVSTPPNAIAYATGAIPLQTMWRTGLLVSIVCLVLTLLGYRLMLPLVF